ncbi:uncharacterized protein LOC128731182 [Anopheles nili]|uniref:uncharacterized protein LOC128731182 n=1 Tax=Anopheles nili TaxID=185578 RepID=UPI00237B5F34|nr:uncharacterized protein LOC128731182 [Anopheles nili]
MSAPEDTTVTAQLAPDNHFQQNVQPSGASTFSLAPATSAPGTTPSPTASVTAATAAVTNAASPSVTTLSVAVAANGSGACSSVTSPANNGSNSGHNSNSECPINKEPTASYSINNTAAPDGSNNNGASVQGDATDATSSCDSEKVAADDSSSLVVGCSSSDNAVVGAATSDSGTSIEPSSSGRASTPITTFSPISAASIVGDTTAAKPLTVSASTSSVVSANAAPAVTNGGGGSSTDRVLMPPGSTSTIRGREVADKHSLEYHCRMLEEELHSVKESEAKIKQQYSESQRRERILARRLAVKEQEMQDYAGQIAELKSAQAPGPAALRSALLDPAVNILFQKLKAELQATKAKLEETQNELSAWKFTPDSNTGKRLMAKCRLLYQENEELGKMTSNGRLAKLESELALQKSYNEEVKKSQLELDDFLQELDEDVEGMQGTIVFLQQELKQTKDSRDELEKELVQLRTYMTANLGPFSSSATNPTSGSTPTDERNSTMMLLMEAQDSNSNSNSHSHGAYHHPEGGGPDSIGGDGGGGDDGSGVGDIGAGITPIYLVNGGGTVSSVASSRLVNKSSSSDDQDMMVYSNRTHCGGVVTNSVELRTTPTTGGGVLSALAPSAVPPTSASDQTVINSSSSSSSNTTAVNGTSIAVAAVGRGGESLVNELKDPLLLSSDGDGNSSAQSGRTSDGNIGSNSGGNDFVTSGNSVNSTSSNSAAVKQHQQQQQQQQQPRSNNNGGRNGGRTTVAARKRNYNDTEVDSVDPLQTDGSASVVVGVVGEAFGNESVDGGVLVGDGSVADVSASAGVLGVANGKLLNATDGSLLPDQQDVETNSNKRMTRSGKGKAVSSSSMSTTASSIQSSSSTSVNASNVLMTSAAKKLRRGSVAPDDEKDPLGETLLPQQQTQQQQSQQPHLHHSQQTISSTNGSN